MTEPLPLEEALQFNSTVLHAALSSPFGAPTHPVGTGLQWCAVSDGYLAKVVGSGTAVEILNHNESMSMVASLDHLAAPVVRIAFYESLLAVALANGSLECYNVLPNAVQLRWSLTQAHSFVSTNITKPFTSSRENAALKAGPLVALEFAKDYQLVLVDATTETASLWNATATTSPNKPRTLIANATAATFLPDATLLVYITRKNTLQLYRHGKAESFSTPSVEDGFTCTHLACHDRDNLVAVYCRVTPSADGDDGGEDDPADHEVAVYHTSLQDPSEWADMGEVVSFFSIPRNGRLVFYSSSLPDSLWCAGCNVGTGIILLQASGVLELNEGAAATMPTTADDEYVYLVGLATCHNTIYMVCTDGSLTQSVLEHSVHDDYFGPATTSPPLVMVKEQLDDEEDDDEDYVPEAIDEDDYDEEDYDEDEDEEDEDEDETLITEGRMTASSFQFPPSTFAAVGSSIASTTESSVTSLPEGQKTGEAAKSTAFGAGTSAPSFTFGSGFQRPVFGQIAATSSSNSFAAFGSPTKGAPSSSPFGAFATATPASASSMAKPLFGATAASTQAPVAAPHPPASQPPSTPVPAHQPPPPFVPAPKPPSITPVVRAPQPPPPPPMPPLSKPRVDPEEVQKRLEDYYTKHKPEKLKDVMKLMKKYKGKEDELLARFEQVYKTELSEETKDKNDEKRSPTPKISNVKPPSGAETGEERSTPPSSLNASSTAPTPVPASFGSDTPLPAFGSSTQPAVSTFSGASTLASASVGAPPSSSPTVRPLFGSTPASAATKPEASQSSSEKSKPEKAEAKIAASVFDEVSKGSESLSTEYFQSLVDSLGEGLYGEELDKQLRKIDPTNTKQIQRSSFIDWYCDFVESADRDLDEDELAERLQEMEEQTTKGREKFDSLSKDGGKTISFEDFEKWLGRNGMGTTFDDATHGKAAREIERLHGAIYFEPLIEWYLAFLYSDEEDYEDAAEDEETRVEDANYNARAAAEGWGAMFAKAKDMWKCDTCLSSNDDDKNKCASCGAGRPGVEDVNAEATPAAAPTGGISFGMPSSGKTAFSFGSVGGPTSGGGSSTVGFAFGTDGLSTAPSSGGFTFGLVKAGEAKTDHSSSYAASGSTFGTGPSAQSSAPGSFSFGTGSSVERSSSVAGGFSFGSPSAKDTKKSDRDIDKMSTPNISNVKTPGVEETPKSSKETGRVLAAAPAPASKMPPSSLYSVPGPQTFGQSSVAASTPNPSLGESRTPISVPVFGAPVSVAPGKSDASPAQPVFASNGDPAATSPFGSKAAPATKIIPLQQRRIEKTSSMEVPSRPVSKFEASFVAEMNKLQESMDSLAHKSSKSESFEKEVVSLIAAREKLFNQIQDFSSEQREMKERAVFLIGRKPDLERQLAEASRLVAIHSKSYEMDIIEHQPLDATSESTRRKLAAAAIMIPRYMDILHSRIKLAEAVCRDDTNGVNLESSGRTVFLEAVKNVSDLGEVVSHASNRGEAKVLEMSQKVPGKWNSLTVVSPPSASPLSVGDRKSRGCRVSPHPGVNGNMLSLLALTTAPQCKAVKIERWKKLEDELKSMSSLPPQQSKIDLSQPILVIKSTDQKERTRTVKQEQTSFLLSPQEREKRPHGTSTAASISANLFTASELDSISSRSDWDSDFTVDQRKVRGMSFNLPRHLKEVSSSDAARESLAKYGTSPEKLAKVTEANKRSEAAPSTKPVDTLRENEVSTPQREPPKSRTPFAGLPPMPPKGTTPQTKRIVNDNSGEGAPVAQIKSSGFAQPLSVPSRHPPSASKSGGSFSASSTLKNDDENSGKIDASPFGSMKGLGDASLFSMDATTAPKHFTSEPDYQALLTKFYEKHNPKRAGDSETIVKTLEKYKGRENEMFAKLAAKYNVGNPLDSVASSPTSKAPEAVSSTPLTPFGITDTKAAASATPSTSFGVSDTNAAASTMFAAKTSPFGSSSTLPPSPFRGPAAAAYTPFGSTASPAPTPFGTAALAPSPFVVSSTAAPFGAPSTATSAPSFGSSISSPFGQPSSASLTPSPFGSPVHGAFGAPGLAPAPGPNAFAGKNPRDMLVAFYTQYNKERISTVDQVLQKYHGKEEQLFRNLAKKYNLDAAVFGLSSFPSPAPNPAGFGGNAIGGFGQPSPLGGGGVFGASSPPAPTTAFGSPSAIGGGSTFGSGFGSSFGGAGSFGGARSPASGGFGSLAQKSGGGFGGPTPFGSPGFQGSPFGGPRR